MIEIAIIAGSLTGPRCQLRIAVRHSLIELDETTPVAVTPCASGRHPIVPSSRITVSARPRM